MDRQLSVGDLVKLRGDHSRNAYAVTEVFPRWVSAWHPMYGHVGAIPDMWELINDPAQPITVEEAPKCVWHDWKDYVGFTERYKYCSRCDAKKEWE